MRSGVGSREEVSLTMLLFETLLCYHVTLAMDLAALASTKVPCGRRSLIRVPYHWTLATSTNLKTLRHHWK